MSEVCQNLNIYSWKKRDRDRVFETQASLFLKTTCLSHDGIAIFLLSSLENLSKDTYTSDQKKREVTILTWLLKTTCISVSTGNQEQSRRMTTECMCLFHSHFPERNRKKKCGVFFKQRVVGTDLQKNRRREKRHEILVTQGKREHKQGNNLRRYWSLTHNVIKGDKVP